jgi:hypothetical protein
MSFFDSIFSAIPGGSLISAGASLLGGLAGGLGASDAADTVAENAAAGRAELNAAKQRGIGYLDTGARGATDILTPMTSERPIMLARNRGLTQQQQIGRDDLIRNGQATLAASGLRGAGRAGVASLMDAVGRYDASAHGANDAQDLTAMQTARGSADAAKNRLADVNLQTGAQKANTEIGTGSAIAGNYQSSGNTLGQIGQTLAGTVGGALTHAGQSVGNGIDYGRAYASGNSPNQGQTQGYPSMYPKPYDEASV